MLSGALNSQCKVTNNPQNDISKLHNKKTNSVNEAPAARVADVRSVLVLAVERRINHLNWHYICKIILSKDFKWILIIFYDFYLLL